ncbi:DUF1385 domain-containing protein [Candidatus Peregrinibacteria bacterium]|nr:DUF1385 domain-containing protein [Candidatus Peregrinibacteria bacterium]
MTENKNFKFDFAVGGQAVIEGVMMRSPAFVTVSVRNEKGEIKSKEDPYLSLTKRLKLLGLPFVRGVVGLFEMMFVGIKALNFSAGVFANKEDVENRTKKQKIIEAVMLATSFIIAIGLSIFLFKFLPLWITDFLSGIYNPIKNSFLYNLIDGVLKTSFFILYIALLNLMPSIKRVFEYHGAEHKSIFTYEKGLPLTVENAKKQSRFHPRCGTSFILIVFMISILIYTMLPRDPDFMTSFLQRLALLPVIAAVSYEFLKFSAKNIENRWMKFAVWPGLKFQLLTTREPDDKQLEVGLHALSRALELEGNSISAQGEFPVP